MVETRMSSNKPYLFRAFYQWIVDNEMTPQLLVDARLPGVEVPQDYVNDGTIVLNVSPRAVPALDVTHDNIAFFASFGGLSTSIFVPFYAVMAIYARETGKGMVFTQEEDDDGGGEPPPTPKNPPSLGDGFGDNKPNGKPKLTVVK